MGICNSALSKIGARQIISLTDGSKRSNFCAEQYPKLRNRELRRHVWNFAKARVKLARSATGPVFGYQNAFALPADWFRAVSLHDNAAGAGSVRYKIEGRFTLSDADDLWLCYIRRVTDPNEMTADFLEVLATLIAMEGAVPLANSTTLKGDLRADYKDLIRSARSIDAIEDFPDALPQGSWAEARLGWSG